MKTPLHGKEALQQFLRALDFGKRIWIKASWDLPLELRPSWWKLKQNGKAVNYVFTGSVRDGNFDLVKCTPNGVEDGVTVWEPNGSKYADGFAYLLSLSKLGATIFFYPNQPDGGIRNKHVSGSNLVFYEFDHQSLQEQWASLQQFTELTGFQPCAVVFTGGKSLHVYFKLSETVSAEHWLRLNRKLTAVVDSDPTICNAARAMRLPGLVRRKEIDGQLAAPAQISLEQSSDVAYSAEVFETALNATGKFPHGISDARWREWVRLTLRKRNGETVDPNAVWLKPDSELYPPRQYAEHNLQYDGSRIPLEICLTRDDRELIASGVGEGSRSVSGFKLATNLIATANFLDAKYIAYESNPRQLFDEFCTRCCPALSAHESEEIWRSASRRNPTPSLTEQAIENCIGAWQRKQNPQQPKKSDRTLSADEWVWQHGLPNWFRNQLAKLPQVFKGFGKRQAARSVATPKPPSLPKVIAYVPGDRVPSREQYEAMGCPTIRFTQEHRLQLYAELVAVGWQFILDRSGTGTGKSHDVGLAEPEQFNVAKLTYLSEDHRNPTVGPIEENYVDLPVRCDGYKKGLLEDLTRKTALNNPHQRWAREGEKPTLAGNCSRTEAFHTLDSKGYTEAKETAELNPICANCLHNWSCGDKDKALPGNNYRSVRAEVLKQSSRIRLNIESMPDLGSEAGAFWEEASRQIKPVQSVEAKLADFDKMFADLETEAPQIYDRLTFLRRQLRPILGGKVKPTQESYYGWNDGALRQLLGAPPEDLEEIIAELEAVQPDLEEILKAGGVLVGDNPDVDSADIKRLNRLVRRESYRSSKQQLESLPANWLLPLLKVWSGLQRGAMRINSGALTVTTRNTRCAEVARALKFNVFLDATGKREFLAQVLGIPAADIVQVEQEPDQFDNLRIVQIKSLGLCGRDRSDSLKQRIGAAKTELRLRHPDIGTIEHKAHADEEAGDGWWFYHNRGSNQFQTRSALACFGTPFQNVGCLQDIYMTLTGDRNVNRDAPGFNDFVQWLTQSELAQTPNRLRANRRTQAQLTCYLATEIDLEFLREYYPGCTIEQVDAFDLTPAAGSVTRQSYWKIQQAVLAAVEATGKAIEDLTQVEAAKFASVTQGRIAQVAAKYGGWRAFLKLLAALLKGINTTTNNSPENNPHLDEDQQFLAQTYLPLVAVEDPPDVVQALLITVQSYGWRVFEAILSAMDSETKGRLLAAMMAGLPDVLRKEFRAAVAAAGG